MVFPAMYFWGYLLQEILKMWITAVTAAKAKGLKVIGLTGRDGGRLGQRADVAVFVPEKETFKIQELHLPSIMFFA